MKNIQAVDNHIREEMLSFDQSWKIKDIKRIRVHWIQLILIFSYMFWKRFYTNRLFSLEWLTYLRFSIIWANIWEALLLLWVVIKMLWWSFHKLQCMWILRFRTNIWEFIHPEDSHARSSLLVAICSLNRHWRFPDFTTITFLFL